MSDFARGARIRKSSEMGTGLRSDAADITIGEIIFCLVDVRTRFYKDVTKEQLLRLVDRAFDAHAKASQATSGAVKSE